MCHTLPTAQDNTWRLLHHAAGTWGVAGADDMLGPDHRSWNAASEVMRTIGIFLSVLTVARGADSSGLHATYAKLPLSFEANRGQTDSRVEFLSRGPGYQFFLTRTGAVMKLGDRAVLRMKLTGANHGAQLEG